ncbi:hypothetical protein JGG43_24415 [Salmonella enterica subsp. enterica serovar Typhimurium]|nr:hypothetical protein [Salmonella enterica subsp. enterica serovar Typhimurium]
MAFAMSNFVTTKEHFRKALLLRFHPKKSAAESHRFLVQAYGKHALSETTCREWFRHFKDNEFDVKDKELPGHPWAGLQHILSCCNPEKPSMLNGTDVNYSM